MATIVNKCTLIKKQEFASNYARTFASPWQVHTYRGKCPTPVESLLDAINRSGMTCSGKSLPCEYFSKRVLKTQHLRAFVVSSLRARIILHVAPDHCTRPHAMNCEMNVGKGTQKTFFTLQMMRVLRVEDFRGDKSIPFEWLG